jgi:hypothetical protein
MNERTHKNCPWCGGKELATYFRGDPETAAYVSCTKCGAAGPLVEVHITLSRRFPVLEAKAWAAWDCRQPGVA